jgi:hypothetical protein
MLTVGAEVAILPVLAAGDHGRSCALEWLDGVANRLVAKRVQCRARAISCGERLDEASSLGMLPIGSVGIVIRLLI